MCRMFHSSSLLTDQMIFCILKFQIVWVCLCVYARVYMCMCAVTHVGRPEEHFAGVGSLLLSCGFHGWSSGHPSGLAATTFIYPLSQLTDLLSNILSTASSFV